jgi:hypothetical protein
MVVKAVFQVLEAAVVVLPEAQGRVVMAATEVMALLLLKFIKI